MLGLLYQITADNIDDIRDRLGKTDSAREIKPGCQFFDYPDHDRPEQWVMAILWPETNRVAVETNGTSEWGDARGHIVALDNGSSFDLFTGQFEVEEEA